LRWPCRKRAVGFQALGSGTQRLLDLSNSLALKKGNVYVTFMIHVKLEARAAAKVRTRIARLEQGNFSNVEPVGEGVSECKIDYGPGYRIYFGRDGMELVILLHGGHKRTQEGDIKTAKLLWKEYKFRKKKEFK
jgi:putative addiction module killer protein